MKRNFTRLATLAVSLVAFMVLASPAWAQGGVVAEIPDVGGLPDTGGMSLTSLLALVGGLILLAIGAAVVVWQFRSGRREHSDE